MFTVNRKSLLSELAILQTVAERKSTIPVLSMVLCEFDGARLHLTATDLDCTLLTQVDASGEPWSGCVPARQLYALTRLLEGEDITLTPRANERLEVKSGTGKHLLPTYPADKFPAVDKPSEGTLTLDSALLSAMIQSVRFSVLDNNGVVKAADQRFTGLQLSLKDGQFKVEASRKVTFAAAECAASEGDPFTVVIPPQAISALQTLAEKDTITIGITDNRATFRNGDRVLVARLFADTFPDFSGVIPEFTQSAEIESSALRSAIQRSLLTTNLDTRNHAESLKLTFTASELAVETQGGDTGKSDERIVITSNLNGTASVFGAFGNQILDWLSIAGERVQVEVNAPTLVRFRPIGEQTFKSEYVVCGVTLKW